MGKDTERDPSSEPSPSDCEASVTECESSVSDIESKDESDAELQDDVQEAFNPEPLKYIPHPEDGMPVPADESFDLRIAPDFTYENNVCVEDCRQWVEVFKDEIDPSDVRIPDFVRNARSRYERNIGTENSRRAFEPLDVQEKWGHSVVLYDQRYILVRPVRPKCKYYKRQLFNNEELGADINEFGGKHLSVSCTARVSTSGAFLCLRDTAVFACDFRDPPCEETVEDFLDKPERERLQKKADMVPLFNLSDPEDIGGGIFG